MIIHCLRCKRDRKAHSYLTQSGRRRNQCMVCRARYVGAPESHVQRGRSLRASKEARAERRAQAELEAAGQGVFPGF